MINENNLKIPENRFRVHTKLKNKYSNGSNSGREILMETKLNERITFR